MTERKEIRQYVFTVEGKTEQWYLNWLCDALNADAQTKYKASIRVQVQPSPQKFIKTVNPYTLEITHFCDYESNSAEHVKRFTDVLDQLNAAKRQRGGGFRYRLGYSNFTFELWMILHKCDFNGVLSDRRQYLEGINRAFNERFETLDQYKHESNFKRCLSKLSLADVQNAIARSKCIMEGKELNGLIPVTYRGFKFFRENPSLSVWESIDTIISECRAE